MRPRLVLFDIDGTLVTARGLGRRSLETAFTARYGSRNVFDAITFHGRTDPDIIEDGLRLVNAPLHDYQPILRAYLTCLESEVATSPPLLLPGVAEMLAELWRAPGVTIGLVTGNVRDGARIKLSRDGMFEGFSVGAFSDDHRDRRELARLARRRAEELRGHSFASPDVFLVGDTRNDVAAARAADAVAVAVTTGGESAEVLAAVSPDHVLPSLRRVDGFLDLVLA